MNNKYARTFAGKKLDVYRILQEFDVTCPVAQHVLKKALCAGQRGHKDVRQDWQDIADSAARKLEMLDEDSGKTEAEIQPVTEQDAEGWIEWGGQGQPVSDDTSVVVKFRIGTEEMTPKAAGYYHWGRDEVEKSYEIVAYKVLP